MTNHERFEVLIEKHLENSGDPGKPTVEICDRLEVNGEEIEIPQNSICLLSVLTRYSKPDVAHERKKAPTRSMVKQSAGEAFIDSIQHRMLDLKISIAELAKKAKISETSLRKYFKKPGAMPIEVTVRICRAVGIYNVALDARGTYYA